MFSFDGFISILDRFIATQSRSWYKHNFFCPWRSGQCQEILITYYLLMYQHFTAVPQFSLSIDSFFCCLWHDNMPLGRRSACKVLPCTLRYFISITHTLMSNCIEYNWLYMLRTTHFSFPMGQRFILGFKIVYPAICHK